MIEEDILLSKLTTFRIGGGARYFSKVENSDEVINCLYFALEKEVPYFVIGGGSNILFGDSMFNGLVLKLVNKQINIKDEINNIIVEADAGLNFDYLISKMVDLNIAGPINLSYIPGNVGASVIQNIGAYGAEISHFVVGVLVIDTSSKKKKILSNQECQFGYRKSLFKNEDGKNFIIEKVFFKMPKKFEPNLSYEEIKKVFLNRESTVTPRKLREVVIEIRKNKLPEISKIGSAGSFFKNPIISSKDFSNLIHRYKDVPYWREKDGNYKVSAAYLIDKIGNLKGFSIGDAFVWEKQALVIANKGNAKSIDVINLAKIIEDKIYSLTKIKLEKEVQIIN